MNTVTIDAIAAETRSTTEDVIRLLDELGARALQDWRGHLVVADDDARRVVERAREEERTRMLHQEAWRAAQRQHAAEAQRIYNEAYETEKERQQRKQLEDIGKRVEGDSSFVSYTFNGGPIPVNFPLAPMYEQRVLEAARLARNKWLEKHPSPTLEDVEV
jgi:hypothetical protein